VWPRLTFVALGLVAVLGAIRVTTANACYPHRSVVTSVQQDPRTRLSADNVNYEEIYSDIWEYSPYIATSASKSGSWIMIDNNKAGLENALRRAWLA